MRLVFDNNVLISAALLKQSIPYMAFKKAVLNNEVILRTEKTLRELKNTIARSKFDKYFPSPLSKEAFLDSFIGSSTNTKVTDRIKECRDPKDDIYLELAVSGKADLIISGDSDLLVLHPFRGIPVITPKEFIDQY